MKNVGSKGRQDTERVQMCGFSYSERRRNLLCLVWLLCRCLVQSCFPSSWVCLEIICCTPLTWTTIRHSAAGVICSQWWNDLKDRCGGSEERQEGEKTIVEDNKEAVHPPPFLQWPIFLPCLVLYDSLFLWSPLSIIHLLFIVSTVMFYLWLSVAQTHKWTMKFLPSRQLMTVSACSSVGGRCAQACVGSVTFCLWFESGPVAASKKPSFCSSRLRLSGKKRREVCHRTLEKHQVILTESSYSSEVMLHLTGLMVFLIIFRVPGK